MANEIAVKPEQLSALQLLIQSNPELAQKLAALQAAATSGISGGGPPILSCKSTRFVVKEDGTATPLCYPSDYPVPELQGQPIAVVPAIVLGAKDGFEKAWYATKFKDGEEPAAPDCWSADGVKPDASSTLKQCESCAGCQHNQFGSGTDANGDPGKGKACPDKKVLAVYFSPKVYKLTVMPTALKGWKQYCKDLSAMGVFLPTAITKISFAKDKNFPSYEFSFGGLLNEAQVKSVLEKLDSAEVKEILSGYTAPAVAQLPASGGSDDAAAKAAEAAAAKAAEKAAKDAEKAAKAAEKKAADEAAKAAAQQTSAGVTLGTATDDQLAALLTL